MKMLKYSAMLVAAVMFFASCDDETTTPEEKDGEIENQTDPDLAVDDLQGDITGDVTLAADEDWILTGGLIVKEGASLTIEAGTTIKALKVGDETGGAQVYIAVERGAKIFVNGTAAAPVKITSNEAAPAAGDWGGVMIMGYAGISHLNGSVVGGAVTEVVDFIYGGSNDADDSGDITYLILEYTGFRINGEKEFNGLTLYGVGSGTKIENVFISHGDDDAIEFFGGSVNVSNLLLVDAKDDFFDWTQGYNGTATNVYAIREAGFSEVSSDPRGIEADGNLDGLTPQFVRQSSPTITGFTFVNNSTTAAAVNDVVKIRRGSSATITNALYVSGAGVPAPGDFVDFGDGAGVAADATTVNISVTGNGADVIATDINKTATVNGASVTSNGTVTVPTTPNAGVSTSIFAWTGYTF